MPYSKEHIARTRAKIVESAAEHFKTKGFEAARIDDIMASAGLTRGGFYAHFESKEALFAVAVKRSFRRMRDYIDGHLEKHTGPDRFRKLLHFCFGRAQRDDLANGCPPAGLSADVARSGKQVRDAYTESIRELGDYLVGYTDPSLKPAEREIIAYGMLAEMIGAVAMARGVNDPEYSDHLLKIARQYAERIDESTR